LLLLGPSALFGQSVLQFPRVISTSDVYTGIAVGNPTSSEASVTFTAFQFDGTVLAGANVRNPVTVTVPAAGQYARLIPEIFGVGAINGWVQASSATPGLTGFAINGNTTLTDLDGAGSTTPGVDVILPLAAEDAAVRTEVTILNVNPEPATATITLYSINGSSMATKDVSLPPRGLTRQTLATLLGLGDFNGASHLRVRADRPVVAHEVVADFQMPGTDLRRETAALTGHAATSATTYIVPQFATGGGWLSLLGVVNASVTAQEVTLTAYKEDGALWQTGTNPKRVTLAGNAALRATVGELFGFPDDVLNTGWIQVATTQGFLTAYSAYGNSLSPSFALVEATQKDQASRYAVYSHVAEGSGFYTGLTVVNPGTETAEVEFYTLRADGTTVGRSTFSIGPNQKVARLFRELLPASFEQLGGWGLLRSSSPVVGAVLFGSSNGFALANVPQQLPAGDFIPPAQTTGSITGTVRSGGEGVAGVEITLNGPVQTRRTTHEAGRYVFTQLPAGQYTVAANRIGATVVPAQRSVSIDRQNVDAIDFEAGGLLPAGAPSLIFVSPATVFAGGSSMSVRAIGSGFSALSVVHINGQPMPTTFINSTELAAAVSSSLLSRTATLQFTVETPPPGGGVSLSLNFEVIAVPSDPLIAGRVGVGSFPAGVIVDRTRRQALVTNQSGDSVTIVNLSTFQAAGEIRVGRSPEGIDIHPGKEIVLVANNGSNDVSVIDLKTNSVSRTLRVGRFPIGVAVNAATNRAYVVNGEDENVSVINLDTFDVLGTFPVGSRPSNIAVNPTTNQAVVTNRGGNNVSLIDLNTGTRVATIAVGDFPRGVVIHPQSNRAVVVNANSNSVSVLNLTSQTVEGTVNVGTGPTSVALHLATNSVVVTNSGVTRGSTNVSGISTVSVINLDRRDVLATITAGSAPFGVAVDEERQLAVVADFGSNDVTVVRIPNPVPRITDIDPKTFPAAGSSFTITVRGTGFIASSVLTLNKQPIPTVFVSSTELRGTISAAMIDQLLQVRNISVENEKGTVSKAVIPQQFNINVSNPGPGGGENPPPENPAAGSIQPLNAVPLLISLSPTEAPVNADLTLTLNGNNINATTIANFGNLQFSPDSSSPTSMTIFIPRAQLAAGNVAVTLINPAPGGGISAALVFRVNGLANPAPAIISVSPGSIVSGSGPTSVVVTVSGSINSTTGTLADVAGTLAGNTLTFALTAGHTENAGTLNGLISTPAPGGGTANFVVNVLNPAPSVGGFSPGGAEIGTPSVALQVGGSNFRNNSVITLAGTPIPTAFGSPNQLTGAIPGNLLAQLGESRVGVTNPAPGGGSAEGGSFRVTEPIPQISSVTPNQPRPGEVIRILGSKFRSDSFVFLRGTNIGSTFVSPTELRATIPNQIAFGSADVVVSNPGINAGPPQVSAPFQITILNPTPVLSGLTPSTGVSGTVVSLVATGTNFFQGSRILFGPEPLTTSFVNSTTLMASVTLGPAGVLNVTVTNPGGLVSNAILFIVTPAQVDNPVPMISNVSPNHVQFGSPDQTVTITGTGFNATTTVMFGNASVNILNRTQTTLVISVPAALLSPGGNKVITVFNPAPGGGSATSNFLANAFLLTPFQVDLSVGQRQQFLEAAGDVSLVWSVNGIDGGNSTFGTISGGGLYTAPNTVPTPSRFRACARVSNNASVLACGIVTINAAPGGGQDLVVVADLNPFLETAMANANNKLMVRNLVNFTPVGPRAGATVARLDCGRLFFGEECSFTTTMRAEIVAAGLSVIRVDSSSGTLTNIPADVKVLFLLRPVSPFTPVEVNTLKTFMSEGGRIVFVGENGEDYGMTALDDLMVKMGSTMRGVSDYVHCEGAVLGADRLRPHQITAGMTQLAVDCASSLTLGPNDLALVFDQSNTKPLAGVARTDNVVLPIAPPTFGSVNPNSAAAGSTVNITITGTNFVKGIDPDLGTNVTISGGKVAVNNINVVSSTQVTATLVIDLDAAVSNRALTITTQNGSVNGSFNVTVPPAPTLTNLTPATGLLGATVRVTLTGTNILPGLNVNTINVGGTGITVTQINVVSPTTIVADFAIAANAAIGARNVSITTPGGTSGNQTFTINPAAPVLSSISPGAGAVGAQVPVIFNGLNFAAPATVTISGTGVTAGVIIVVSPTMITTTFTIAANAALGTRDVTVTTPGGTSNIAPFLVTQAFNGALWSGAVSTNWSTALNWSSGNVPDATTNVLISAAAPRQPVLTANSFALNITVENGATLDTAGFTLTVFGDVNAGNTITGNGTLLLTGNGTLTGTVPNVTVMGNTVVPALAIANINGNLTIQSTGSFEVIGNATVTGNMSTLNSGALKMVNAGGVLTVNGIVTIASTVNSTGHFTAGTLNIKGNFSNTGTNQNFLLSGTHLTVFNGGSAQAISFSFPSGNNQHFRNLRLTNTAGVVLSSDVHVSGSLEINAAGSLSGTGALDLVGALTTVAGSSVTVPNVTLQGAMAVSGSFSPAQTAFVGNPQTIQAGLGYQTVFVSGTVSLPPASTTTFAGNLLIANGSLDIAGATLTVTGTFTVNSSGGLKMNDAASVLNVNGQAAFSNNINGAGQLTAGTLNLKSHFTVAGGAQNFQASGTHITTLTGSAAQTISFNNAGPSNQRFHHLILNNAAGFAFGTAAHVGGDLTVSTGNSTGAGPVTIGGNLADFVGGRWQVNSTTLSGSPLVLPATLSTNLTITGNTVMPINMTLTGNLTVSGGSLEVAGTTMLVSGTFQTTAGGSLKMTHGAGNLTINGAATFGGGGNDGNMTAGTLNLKGNFSATNANVTGFAASGTHTTILNGSVSQGLSMAFPSPIQQHFQNLTLNNAAGAVFSTIQVNGNMLVSTGNATGAGPVTIAGNLTDAVGNRWQPTNTTLSGSPTVIPATLTTNLTTTGALVLPGNLTLTGNLIVGGGSFDVAGTTSLVTGTLTTSGGGSLRMNNVAGNLTVNGNASFGGGSNDGNMTAGTLNLKGSFVATNSNATNFAASGTHMTVFNGGSAQGINMAFATPAQQRFQNLTLNNAAGLLFNTAAQVNGSATISTGIASGPGPVTIAGNLVDAVGNRWRTAATILSGSPVGIPTALTTNLTFSGIATLAPNSSLTLTGNLTISGSLDTSSYTTTLVTGSLTTIGSGILKMNHFGCSLTVNGAATFGGGSTNGQLTAGTLNVKGAFTATNADAQAFAASGSHTTVLNGVLAQSVSMSFPNPTQQRFQNLTLNNAAGASFGTVQINGDVMLNAGVASGTGPVIIGGNIYDVPDANRWQPAATTLTGNPSAIPNVMTTSLTFTGTASLPNDTYVFGNVIVSGASAKLDVNCFEIFVTGNFSTTSGGRLEMMMGGGECGGTLGILGNATFDGGSTSGLLDYGDLLLLGNFTATNSNATNFAPGNNFIVSLDGTVQQTVTMALPGVNSQRFSYLEIFNTAGVSMGSNIFVAGQLYVLENGEINSRIIGNGRTLTVNSFYVQGLDLDNVLLSLTPGQFDFLYADDLVFSNYADSATRLRVSGPTGTFNFYNVNYAQGVPVTGYLVNATDTNPLDAALRLIMHTSPYIPPGQGNPRTIVNGGAIVTWSD